MHPSREVGRFDNKTISRRDRVNADVRPHTTRPTHLSSGGTRFTPRSLSASNLAHPQKSLTSLVTISHSPWMTHSTWWSEARLAPPLSWRLPRLRRPQRSSWGRTGVQLLRLSGRRPHSSVMSRSIELLLGLRLAWEVANR
jgi:hypothetical protein